MKKTKIERYQCDAWGCSTSEDVEEGKPSKIGWRSIALDYSETHTHKMAMRFFQLCPVCVCVIFGPDCATDEQKERAIVYGALYRREDQ